MARPNPLAIAIKARIAKNRDALTDVICADEALLVSAKPGKARALLEGRA